MVVEVLLFGGGFGILWFGPWGRGDVQAYAPVGVVGHGGDGGAEEDMVWWEAAHRGVDVALGAVLER